jgi:methyltransferase
MLRLAGYTVLVGLVALERCAELVVARRNGRIARSHGGVEFGRRHYPVIVLLHSGLLAGAVAEVWLRRPGVPAGFAAAMLALLVAAEILRWWCIATLGPQWNTRILVIPGARRVRHGPYRWLRHPNYVAVALEGAALPLIGGAWITAVVFTVANLALLTWRIRTENDALENLAQTDQRE